MDPRSANGPESNFEDWGSSYAELLMSHEDAILQPQYKILGFIVITKDIQEQ